MQTIVVLDYGMSNLRSVARAVELAAAGRARVRVSGDPEAVLDADRIVFPGQGAIGSCMQGLAATGLDAALRAVIGRRPFLGICLGLQSLFDWSEEDGGTAGLGLFRGRVRRFACPLQDAEGRRLKVPHMGWNQVRFLRAHPLFEGLEAGERFYFVHSFHCEPADPALTVATAEYPDPFCAAIAAPGVFATQFHPEKSQRAGARLLANFVGWDGRCPDAGHDC